MRPCKCLESLMRLILSGNTGVLSVPCRRMFETWHRVMCDHRMVTRDDIVVSRPEQLSGHSKDDDWSTGGDYVTQHMD